MRLLDIRPPDDVPRLLEDTARKRPSLQRSGYWRHRVKDGTVIDVEIVSHTIPFAGRAAALVIAQDVTELLRKQKALRDSEERYALAVLGAKDGLWDWDLSTGEIFLADRWKAMLGYERGEIGSRREDWFARVHPDDRPALEKAIEAHLSGMTAQLECEYRARHRDGTERWLLTRGVAVRDAQGRPYRMAGSQADITERRRAEEQARYDAFHDALTLLPNRALFMDRLGVAIARARRKHQYVFGVLFIDVDRFKVVNDSLGHVIGDQLLTGIARRLESCLREGDTLARWGGDEYTILLDGIGSAGDATRIAERVQRELRASFTLDGHDVYVTASIGMALSSAEYERPEDVVRDADTAMYRAKARGRDRYAIFGESMHAQAVALLKLESELRHAVERDELRLHYQPIVALRDTRVIGFEALVRWQHPAKGLVPPNEFIPAAEESGLIVALGRWVLRESCRQMRVWLDGGGSHTAISVNVNVAARQLAEPGFADEVDVALRRFDLSPDRLKIEITESVLIEHVDVATRVLATLRERGVKICMDDFGTGYSSLSNLLRYPVDVLKIDRAFVGRIDSGENGREDGSPIVGTILTLARSLGLGVVAEGVETERQRSRLVELECEHAQGFLFARPLEADAAWRYATDRRPSLP
jgi:diguanylate cyclase (GGDEF)-like protein/PAS domain S-box-containing protein